MHNSSEFVADGEDRIRDANESVVRNQIESKYADQLNNASWLQRRKLKKQIRNEIKDRLDELAPPDAMY